MKEYLVKTYVSPVWGGSLTVKAGEIPNLEYGYTVRGVNADYALVIHAPAATPSLIQEAVAALCAAVCRSEGYQGAKAARLRQWALRCLESALEDYDGIIVSEMLFRAARYN